MTRCHVIPPYLTERLPLPDRTEDVRHDVALRAERRVTVALTTDVGPRVDVYDSAGLQVTTGARAADQDVSARNATAGLVATWTTLREHGVEVSPMVAHVNYGSRYDNAFWDGRQMIFGDGDGRYFGDFTAPVDVCAHERQHGVTGDLLDYQDQAGALNEHLSDAVGAVVRQQRHRLAVQDPAAWLIGEGLLLEPGARGLRDMLHPGTAYDTAGLGRDPQPSHMDAYVVTHEDDGGVHINSGIPNRAFALACIAADDPRPILAVWLDTLSKIKNPACDFAAFAALTVALGREHTSAIRDAWVAVGVLQPRSATPDAGAPFRLDVSAEVGARVAAVAARRKVSSSRWLEDRLRAYFGLPPQA